MSSKHDNINARGKAKFRSELLRNNLVACLIHLAIFIPFFLWTQTLIFMSYDSIHSEAIQIIFVIAFIALPLAAIYIYSGYRFLEPLPTLNFLSVFALPTIFLIINGLALFEAPAFSADIYYLTWQAFPLSYFAMIANFSGYGVITIFLLGSPNVIDNFWIHAVVMFTAASLIPSLLMYLGICLNVLRHETKELNGEGDHDQQT